MRYTFAALALAMSMSMIVDVRDATAHLTPSDDVSAADPSAQYVQAEIVACTNAQLARTLYKRGNKDGLFFNDYSFFKTLQRAGICRLVTVTLSTDGVDQCRKRSPQCVGFEVRRGNALLFGLILPSVYEE